MARWRGAVKRAVVAVGLVWSDATLADETYGVVRGAVTDLALDDVGNPHVEVRIETPDGPFRASINVRSSEPPHHLIAALTRSIPEDLAAALLSLDHGFTPVERGVLALDYVHRPLAERGDFVPVTYRRPGPDNDLVEAIQTVLRRAADGGAEIFVFGNAWDADPAQRDPFFGFRPNRGLHNVHMNQGSVGRFRSTNRASRDGAFFLYEPRTGQWTAVFLAFQNQCWDTDPRTGHCR